MADLNVDKFPNGTVSEDGLTITIDMTTREKQSHRLVIPYDQLEWILQALLKLSAGAYERQIQSGRIAPTPNLTDDPLVAEGFRTIVGNGAATMQIAGRPASTYPRGVLQMGSFRVDESHARDLAQRLLAVADQLKQTSKPS